MFKRIAAFAYGLVCYGVFFTTLLHVQVVPDGIGEIIARQRPGWGYIKVGH